MVTTLARQLISYLTPSLAPSIIPFASTSTFRFASSAARVSKKNGKARQNRIEGDGAEYDYERHAFEPEDDQASSFPAWEELRSESENTSSVVLEVDPSWHAESSEDFSITEEWEKSKGSSRWGDVGEERKPKAIPSIQVRPRPPSVPFDAVTTPISSAEFQSRFNPPPIPTSLRYDFTSKKKDFPLRRPLLPPPSRSYEWNSPPPVEPFVPFGVPTRHPIQPHEIPLLDRYDWRLSSPLHQLPRYSKPKFVEGSNIQAPRYPPVLSLSRPGSDWPNRQGNNKLIGVGLEPANEGVRSGRFQAHEKWGWKVPVGDEMKSTWIALDTWRTEPDRLLTLCKVSDEIAHLAKLRRLGTPTERVERGYTLIGAIGTWAPATIKQKDKERAAAAQNPQQSTVASTRRPPSICYLSMDDKLLTIGAPSRLGSKYVVGDTLRLTVIDPTRNPNGPQPAQKPHTDSDPPQCEILDIKDGQIKVAFDVMWPIEEDIYQVDLGLSNTTYAIQKKAIDNLAHDPISQILSNATDMLARQQKAHAGKVTKVEEYSLRGTSIRETIVLPLELQKGNITHTALDLVDSDSPEVEVARLAIPILPMIHSDRTSTASNPSSLFSGNQLINSWIKRYGRKGSPLVMEGDPALDLNESQTKAVAMALGEELSLIQGPPGTGKSATIVAIIHLLKSHFRIPQPILLAAPTHVAVDSLVSNLVDKGLNPIRLGKTEKIGSKSTRWSIQERVLAHPMHESLADLRGESDQARNELTVAREAAEKRKSPSPKLDRELLGLETMYKQLWARQFACEKRLYSSLFASVDVFCTTAMGSGTNRLLNMVDFPIVFLDEAAMCTEPITLVPLMKGAQHVTLIGDHMQLPAIVSSQTARTERLHVSLFERLMNSQAVKSVLLDTQYRMRPCISAFPNFSFYNSALKDSSLISQRPAAPKSKFYNLSPTTKGFEPTVFVSHSGPESTQYQSTINKAEVQIVLEIVEDLLHQNPSLKASDIGIISPYAAQTRLLRETFQFNAAYALNETLGEVRATEASEVEVNTVDGFQGREKKVIILSTVRSNKVGQIGFLTDKRRLNVALTRAQDALFVVGNPKTLSMATVSEWFPADVDADASIWRRFIEFMTERNLVKEA